MNKESAVKALSACCMILVSVISVLSFSGCYNNTPPEFSGFIRVSDGKLVDGNGLEYVIRGINTTDNWYSTFYPEAHSYEGYADLASYGMNTVRVCLNASKFEKEVDGEWVIREDGIQMLKDSIANAAAAGLKCIIDMHCPPQCGVNAFDNNEDSAPNYRSLIENPDLQVRFIAIWTALAENFADNANVLAYGLVNEPVGPRDGAATEENLRNAVKRYEDDLLKPTVAAIRAVDKNHIIILQQLNATYDVNLPGDIFAEGGVPVTWGLSSEIAWPTIDDPQKNIMLEVHNYKSGGVWAGGSDGIYGYAPLVASGILTKNLTPYTSSPWVVWDSWSAQGVRTSNLVSTEEFESSSSEELGTKWFNAATKVNRLYNEPAVRELYDFAYVDSLTLSLNFGSDAPEQPLDMRYWIDDISLVKRDSNGDEIARLDVDFNDLTKLRMLGGDTMIDFIVDNPFDSGEDKLLYFDNTMLSGNGYQGYYSLPLFNNLPFFEDEEWEISSKILAVGDGTPTDTETTSYARYKASLDRYNIIDPDKPIVRYKNKDSFEITFQDYMAACAKYDCPVYIGELGAQYVDKDDPNYNNDPNYERWFIDIIETITKYNAGFTWHSCVGGGFGLYINRPIGDENRNELIAKMFREHLFAEYTNKR